MGFVNQFPYSDFHEMNLDWLIKQTKESMNNIEVLQEQMAEIIVVTKDQIELMINAAIASNNIQLYNDMLQLKNEITEAYKNYVANQINLLKIYVDNQDSYYFEQAKLHSDNNLAIAKQYTDDKILNYTIMINPITGQYDDVRNVINDIVSNLLSNDALTATEYDTLELTASDYDNYELTAYDYDFNGKNLLV